MMHNSAQRLREQFEQCIGIIRQASVEILSLLEVRVSEGKDPRWFLEQLDNARLSLGGWGAVAHRLKLNDAELTQFTLQLRHLQQRVPQYESGQDVSEDQLITALRFMTALEHLRQKQPLLTYSTELALPGGTQQQRALAQLRAIELMIASLVYEAWPDSVRLSNHLKTQFGVDRVRRWLKLGERNDVLSGMLFSELALLLVDKKEFSQHYAGLFDDPAALTLFVEPRKTLQIFLDDIRQIRNTVTSQHPLTPVQLSLLDNYFPQITDAVQRAFNEGRTKTSPAALQAVGVDELHGFWEWAQKKAKATGGDIFEVRDNIERQGLRAPRSREEQEQLVSGLLWGAVGVMVLMMFGGGLWLFTSGSSAPAVAQVQPLQVEMEGPVREKPSARENLTRMGITWDESNFRSAIGRNDIRVATWFLQGGMDWKLSWTEEAMAANHEDVLDLLLRYRLQMSELKPCRRFINTLTHAMADGAPLTGQRKAYLRAFCTTPAVVKRQQYEAEQAQKRNAAAPSAFNKKWATIQSSIYEVID
ncbi:STY4199 family HEPN domain-containing protein [Enterobacter sp.]|uniref:STY4199 family HEPN domain-containing protein n=1 Tax=Enterobacter sp. TaxID=42895 RepID=UPI00296F0EC7|nr:STY4199 family HEPN domain-containing protein [Enterobacter sp.]